VALDAGTGRRPLTWSAQSAATYAERAHDENTGQYQLTGQVTAAVAVMIAVRAFGLLDALGAILAAGEAVTVHEVTWHVDWDNPAWPSVRAAAVQAAITKGRDYAAALGGSLRGVEHIAAPGSSAAATRSPGLPAAARWRKRPAGVVRSPMRPRLIRFPGN